MKFSEIKGIPLSSRNFSDEQNDFFCVLAGYSYLSDNLFGFKINLLTNEKPTCHHVPYFY